MFDALLDNDCITEEDIYEPEFFEIAEDFVRVDGPVLALQPSGSAQEPPSVSGQQLAAVFGKRQEVCVAGQ